MFFMTINPHINPCAQRRLKLNTHFIKAHLEGGAKLASVLPFSVELGLSGGR